MAEKYKSFDGWGLPCEEPWSNKSIADSLAVLESMRKRYPWGCPFTREDTWDPRTGRACHGYAPTWDRVRREIILGQHLPQKEKTPSKTISEGAHGWLSRLFRVFR